MGASAGKDADLILIRTTDANTAPGTNAVATVTAFAHARNVDTVRPSLSRARRREVRFGIEADVGPDPPSPA